MPDDGDLYQSVRRKGTVLSYVLAVRCHDILIVLLLLLWPSSPRPSPPIGRGSENRYYTGVKNIVLMVSVGTSERRVINRNVTAAAVRPLADDAVGARVLSHRHLLQPTAAAVRVRTHVVFKHSRARVYTWTTRGSIHWYTYTVRAQCTVWITRIL